MEGFNTLWYMVAQGKTWTLFHGGMREEMMRGDDGGEGDEGDV